MTVDSPAAVIRRLLSCFKSEGIEDFDWAWAEALNRLPKPQPQAWEEVLVRHMAVWGEFWEASASDFEAETQVVVAALERIARETEVAARRGSGVSSLSPGGL